MTESVSPPSRRWMRIANAHRSTLVLITMWLLGLLSLGAVLVLQGRLDARRQAQVTVAGLRLQMNELPRVALDINHGFTQAEVAAELRSREASITATAASLNGLSGGTRDSLLVMDRLSLVFALLDRVNILASSGHLQAATDTLGFALIPGAAGYELNSLFDRIGGDYGRQAADARRFADIGSVVAIFLVLIAFSLVLHRATRLARDKHQLLEQSREDAFTDQLTGLWNRRKLFSDLDELLLLPEPAPPVVLGMLDLDGFKAYNDMFGHPAGDALLARLGQKLNAALEGAGRAYRMGGDEFCVIALGDRAEAVLQLARDTLRDDADGISVSCSLGTVRIEQPRMTAAEAFRMADQRLYDDKRSSRAPDEALPAEPRLAESAGRASVAA
jgi:diguanylate cyclase (GGDEF)-like protein